MNHARADVAIIGGGVAGLWTRAVLARAGWSVVLLEHAALGAGQTVASQGILHRGVKYALSAEAKEASGQLAAAQADWRCALGLAPGPSPVDLRGVEVLADRMHLWAGGLLEKATGVGAALAMRSEVRRLARAEFPPAFRESPGSVAVWEVDELSVSASSLVARLAAADEGPILKTRPVDRRDPAGGRLQLVGEGGREVDLDVSAVVLTAGPGNEEMLAQLGSPDQAQRRPLHMVLADGLPVPLFAHLPRPGSDKPRLTITSAKTASGWCWYIGGDVAETGVARSREEQVEHTKRELAETLGWIDLSRARWATHRVDRAEGRTESGRRPDGPVLHVLGRTIAVWPTKLALAPVAARLVERQLRELGVSPRGGEWAALSGWPAPSIAAPPWNDPELAWT